MAMNYEELAKAKDQMTGYSLVENRKLADIILRMVMDLSALGATSAMWMRMAETMAELGDLVEEANAPKGEIH
jgi:hypothetical protein